MNFGIWDEISSAEIELILDIKEREPLRSSIVDEADRNTS